MPWRPRRKKVDKLRFVLFTLTATDAKLGHHISHNLITTTTERGLGVSQNFNFSDLEEEEGECVPDEGGRHVHRPEDARVPSDRRRVGVVGQQVSLGDKK